MKDEKRLARIVALKKRQEDLRRADVAQAAERVREAEEALEERKKHEDVLYAALGGAREVAAHELQATAALLAEHRRTLVGVTEALRERREEHEAHTAALVDVARARHALENRRQALKDARIEREERVDQVLLDDAARGGGRQ